jgi:hypothetical protein
MEFATTLAPRSCELTQKSPASHLILAPTFDTTTP